MTEYKRLDERAWINFGKRLTDKQDPELLNKQQAFLQACKDCENFLSYLEKELPNEKDCFIEGEAINFEDDFSFSTEGAFFSPPGDIQKSIWNTFKELPHEIKMKSGFWGHIVIELIKSNRLKPSYLAYNGGKEEGSYEIDVALQTNESEQVDSCVRRVLRSMCNPEPRGKRVVFNDFSIGKSYWRWHWADRMSGYDSLPKKTDEILSLLDDINYGVFSEKMHTAKSYISQTNTLAGLLLFLKEKGNNGNFKKKQIPLKKVIDRLAYLSAWKAIEVQSPEDNKKEIQNITSTLNPAT